MIHIVESKSYKSDSDRSLRSYYGRLKERIKNADINITELTLGINETLQYIGTINEMLEEFRSELTDDVEEIKPFLPEKKKDELSETLDKIKEALDENDIKDITKEIEDASTCLAHCQSCFSGSFTRCDSMDSCGFAQGPNPCTECVSEQTGCSFCNTGQTLTCPSTYNPCVVSDAICEEAYTSACTTCYQKLYNSCSQEQISCDFSAGCTNCQNNVQSCNNCQNNVGTCSSCYGGSVGTCGEGQLNPCQADWNDEFCHAGIDPGCAYTAPDECKASWDKECGRQHQNCPIDYTACVRNNLICAAGQTACDGGHIPSGDTGGVDDSCVMHYVWKCGKGNGVECFLGYDGESCKAGYKLEVQGQDPISCPKEHGLSCGTNNSSCAGGFTSPGTNCPTKHATTNGETYCESDFEGSSGWEKCKTKFDGDTCQVDYTDSLHGIACEMGYVEGPPPGCMQGYTAEGTTCSFCHGAAYGCGGCYEVEYCSKCNTNQTSCTACVRGQTTCDACVKGEEGHSTDVCSNCYGGCQSIWDRQKDCFTGSYGAAPPCTICNIGCQYCDSSCYSGQSCNDCGSSQDCGSSNCGASNCGKSNCGKSNCGQCESGESGCSNCDDVSPCVCSHTGNYGCGTLNCGGPSCGLSFGICQLIQ